MTQEEINDSMGRARLFIKKGIEWRNTDVKASNSLSALANIFEVIYETNNKIIKLEEKIIKLEEKIIKLEEK